jgi:chaperone modulatory protein CbpM
MKKTVSYRRADLMDTLDLVELCSFCHVRQDWVVTLVDHGVLEACGLERPNWRFDPVNIARARKAQRLVRDFGLNVTGVALVLDLMEERDAQARKLAQFMTM